MGITVFVHSKVKPTMSKAKAKVKATQYEVNII